MFCRELSDVPVGTPIDTCFCLDSKWGFRSYTRAGSQRWMFNGRLTDKTGIVALVYFGVAENETQDAFDNMSIGQIVRVNGDVSEYQGNPQIRIDCTNPSHFIRPATDGEFERAKFIPESNRVIEEMWNDIQVLIDSITNPHIQLLFEKILADEELVTKFKISPGARKYHHACTSGLLEHVWETIQYCELATAVHPSLDRDLILCGAFVHDIGKIRENEITDSIMETPEGMLLGHTYLGMNMIKEKILQIDDFPTELEMKLMHIILSHHGKTEFGAGVEPKTAEAATVSAADVMGSWVTQFIRARKDSTGDDFKTYRRPLGWVFRL